MKKFYQKYRELITYFFVGLSTTLMNWLICFIYVSLFGDKGALNTIASTVLAWLISTVYAFFMYKLFVFRSKDMSPKKVLVEGSEFFGARVVTLGVEALGMTFLQNILGFENLIFAFTVTNAGAKVFEIPLSGYVFSKGCMLVITTVANYLFSKFVIFKKKKEVKE